MAEEEKARGFQGKQGRFLNLVSIAHRIEPLLRLGIALRGRLSVPLRGPVEAAPDPEPVLLHDAEHALGRSVTVLCIPPA